MVRGSRRLVRCLLLPALLALADQVRGADRPVARILVERDGVVRVTDTGLRQAGFLVQRGEWNRLRLRSGGVELPLLLEAPAADDAGAFAFRFLGRHRRGPQTHVSPYGATNVYLLDLAPSARHRRRLRPVASAAIPPGWPRSEDSAVVLHLERDLRLVDFGGGEAPAESWYWEEIRATDPAPVEVKVALPDLLRARPVTLKIRFMGYSSLPGPLDHQLEISWNDTALGRAAWDGRRPFTFEAVIEGPRALVGENRLRFDARGPVRGRIDSLLLDSVEVAFSRANTLQPDGQADVSADTGHGVVIHGTGQEPAELWDTRAPRVFSARRVGGDSEWRPPRGAPTPARFVATRRGDGWPPLGIASRSAADLRRGGADFLIVCPDALAPAAERLARARRAEGLRTRIVRIEDVYDAFGEGLLDPAALRAFLRHALERWKPRPAYVLLLGDASWDYRGLLRAPDEASAVADEAGAPAPGDPPGRLRVPTLRYRTGAGTGASDALLVQRAGDYGIPAVAVGRLPAATLDEAEAMVDKSLRHAAGPQGGALVFADHVGEHRDACVRLAAAAGGLGYGVAALCSGPDPVSGAPLWRDVFSAMGRGVDLAVFVGHGSRDVLQTGPRPDTSRDQDVITWRQLDSLPPAPTLPVVLALSCDVAPFDHPWADSIGERLLRLPDRGAVAVIAASLRTPPAYALAEGFFAALAGRRSARLGDLFLAALRNTPATETRYSYNLLADPTLPIRLEGSHSQ